MLCLSLVNLAKIQSHGDTPCSRHCGGERNSGRPGRATSSHSPCIYLPAHASTSRTEPTDTLAKLCRAHARKYSLPATAQGWGQPLAPPGVRSAEQRPLNVRLKEMTIELGMGVGR